MRNIAKRFLSVAIICIMLACVACAKSETKTVTKSDTQATVANEVTAQPKTTEKPEAAVATERPAATTTQEEPETTEQPQPLDYMEIFIRCTDDSGAPVKDVAVQICTDFECCMKKTDENGEINYTGAVDEYIIHGLRAPEGYEFGDEAEEKVTETGKVVELKLIKQNP